MTNHEKYRSGLTLIELLVVVFLVAILVALLAPAIFSARNLSLQVSSKNKVLALFFAAEQYAGLHGGKLPSSLNNPVPPHYCTSVQTTLLWYMEGGKSYLENWFNPDHFPSDYSHPAMVSPADYSLFSTHCSDKPHAQLCSYPVNAQVFGRQANLFQSFSDGTSNTILFSEHLANCKYNIFQHTTSERTSPPGIDPLIRRCTFADGGIPDVYTFGDVYPVTNRSSLISLPSVPGKTFQIRPSVLDCDPTIPQTPHFSLICGFADGSIRSFHPKMAEQTFWAMVTMNGGELVGAD